MNLHAVETRNAANGEPPRARLYGLFWRWHFFAALIVIPFVIWQSATGSLYLWSEWWMDTMHPELRFVAPASRSAPPSAQVAAALASLPRETPPIGGHPPAMDAMHHGHESTSSPLPTPAGSAHVHSISATPGAGPPVIAILISADARRSTTVLVQDAHGLPYPIFVDPHDAHVLGTLGSAAWLPGLTRALHGGWPLGKPGSWLLELGDGWALVMLLTGLYLWWPRGRGFFAALWPRFGAGTRVLLRDLHSCVAVWFALVLLFFLSSALPWTAFWGNQLLARVEAALHQTSPAGFSPGGASTAQIAAALGSLDEVVASARARHVKGTLDIRLAPWPNAPLFITNPHTLPGDDRTLLADARTGAISGEFANPDLPIMPRLVALGVHVHQGDFGPINLWLNTAFALALLWLSATGTISWWTRRPKRSLGAPPKAKLPWPRPVLMAAFALCVVLPLLGASVLLISLADWGFCRGTLAVRPNRR